MNEKEHEHLGGMRVPDTLTKKREELGEKEWKSAKKYMIITAICIFSGLALFLIYATRLGDDTLLPVIKLL